MRFCIKNIIFLIIFCSFPFLAQGENCIDKKDSETLEKFFSYLVYRSSIGYSLCGDKPLATETFFSIKNTPPKQKRNVPKLLFSHYGYSILWKGWACWERYAPLFPSNKFVLRFIKRYDTLVLINKQASKTVIEENIDFFQKRLQTTETADEIFLKLCYPKEGEDFLFKDIALLGILYGYGKNNATAFANRCYFQCLSPYSIQNPFEPVIGYGFILIDNGTNEKENKKATQMIEEARKNIYSNFTNKRALDVFLKIYTK